MVKPICAVFLVVSTGAVAASLIGCTPSTPRKSAEKTTLAVDQQEVVDGSPDASPEAPITCASRQPYQQSCMPKDGCVLEKGACRAAANDCERITPVSRVYDYPTTGPTTTYAKGDPCALVNPRCGYDIRTGSCQEFVAVTECPASAKDAIATYVFCMHEKQAKLNCSYDDERGITFECALPAFPPSGVNRPESFYDVPMSWNGYPHYDDRGCPRFRVAYQARCKEPRALKCSTGAGVFQCVKSRWKMTVKYGPRP